MSAPVTDHLDHCHNHHCQARSELLVRIITLLATFVCRCCDPFLCTQFSCTVTLRCNDTNSVYSCILQFTPPCRGSPTCVTTIQQPSCSLLPCLSHSLYTTCINVWERTCSHSGMKTAMLKYLSPPRFSAYSPSNCKFLNLHRSCEIACLFFFADALRVHRKSKFGMHYRIITDILVIQYPIWYESSWNIYRLSNPIIVDWKNFSLSPPSLGPLSMPLCPLSPRKRVTTAAKAIVSRAPMSILPLSTLHRSVSSYQHCSST